MKVKSKKIFHMLFANRECNLNKDDWPPRRNKIRWVSKEEHVNLYYFLTGRQDD